VWMRLLDLPPVLWTKSTLSLLIAVVAAAVGCLLHLDLTVELLSKGHFTRMAVEIDLS